VQPSVVLQDDGECVPRERRAPVEGAEELVDALDAGLVRYHRYPDARHSIYADEPRAMEATIAFVEEVSPIRARA
jgi:dipeptidyl aminopeptidase/acylaminoacyl peptidase